MPFSEALVQEYIRKSPRNAHVLDVCCGTDALGVIKRLVDSNFHVTAVDFLEKIILFFRGNIRSKKTDYQYVKNVSFLVQDVRVLGFKPESFDGITGIYALDYFQKEEFIGVIKSFFHLLKPQGLLLLSFGIEPEAISEGLTNALYFQKIYDLVLDTGFAIISARSKYDSPYHWILANLH